MPGPAPVLIELVGNHHTHEPEGRSVSCKGNVSAMITNCLATHGHEHANYNKSRADWKPIAAGIMNWNPIAAGKLADWNPVASISHVEYQTAIHKYLHVPVI